MEKNIFKKTDVFIQMFKRKLSRENDINTLYISSYGNYLS
jgi:hypothetical protein